MLTNIQLNRYADVLVWGLATARKKALRRNDIVLIRSDVAGLCLAECVQARLLDMGLQPVVRIGLTHGMERVFYENANAKQLEFIPPGEKELFGQLSGGVYILAPESLTHLAGIDPKRIAKTVLARKPLKEILDKREEAGQFGWTLCMVPTPELACSAGLTARQYANQVIKACYLDHEDSVSKWKTFYSEAADVKKWLTKLRVKYYQIESNNTDLRITPGDQRKWVGISGHNIPSFEFFISPDWRGTEGVYFANQPSFRSGNYVQAVRLEFKKGKVVGVTAEKGSDFVQKQLAMDAGAGRVGEFSLTDKRFSKIDKFMANTLFDENYGGRYGNCHIALGSSYSDTFDGDPKKLTNETKKQLGFNDSALHWDLVSTEKKRVVAHLVSGGKMTIYDDGRFTND